MSIYGNSLALNIGPALGVSMVPMPTAKALNVGYSRVARTEATQFQVFVRHDSGASGSQCASFFNH